MRLPFKPPRKATGKRYSGSHAPEGNQPAPKAARQGSEGGELESRGTESCNALTSAVQSSSAPGMRVFKVLHCKNECKKQRHKKSFQDGILTYKGDTLTLLDEHGKVLTSGKPTHVEEMKENMAFQLGAREVEISEEIAESEYKSGSVFVRSSSSCTQPQEQGANNPLINKHRFRNVSVLSRNQRQPLREVKRSPLHDPEASDAVVLWRANCEPDREVSVVVDPLLGKKLRPHQVEGVRFLYECTEGMRCIDGHPLSGAILADSMGLGKTLQVITLVWTLLRQSPRGKAHVKKVLIACPASLVGNWESEIHKWLGKERLGVLALKSGGSEARRSIELWRNVQQRKWPVLCAGYEMLQVRKAFAKCHFTLRIARIVFLPQSCSELIRAARPGLLVLDEGHRLKNKNGSKTLSSLKGLNAQRRVLLTGTPLQNDLEELYTLADFTCPGTLGSLVHFRSVFMGPIRASSEENACESDQELGRERYRELSARLQCFMLRRSNDVNVGHLPNKYEKTLFIRPSQAQLDAYEALLGTAEIGHLLSFGQENGMPVLSAIDLVKKVINIPQLLTENDRSEESVPFSAAADAVRRHSTRPGSNISAKLEALLTLAESIYNHTTERLVIASYSTAVLDAISDAFKRKGWAFTRLDGSTPANERTSIVKRFNSGETGRFFLLSVKSGGTGLNLVGASRMVLYDCDWNPANDAQALARVWREGQTLPVHIYRFLLTGTMEEKIYQRQLSKGEMETMLDGGKRNLQLTAEELKDLFQLDKETDSSTRELILSKCEHQAGWRESVNLSKNSGKESLAPDNSSRNQGDTAEEGEFW